MAEHLSKTDKLMNPRQMRFPDHFIEDIHSLMMNVVRDIVEGYHKVCIHIIISAKILLMS